MVDEEIQDVREKCAGNNKIYEAGIGNNPNHTFKEGKKDFRTYVLISKKNILLFLGCRQK
jgi:hypothetical protein